MAADSVLAQVLARVADRAKAGTLPVVIFDLDDTLFSTAQRNLFIIREFAADHGAQYPDFARVAAPLGLDDMSWSVTDALERAGLAAGSPSLAPSAFPSFWSARFFSNRYVELDLPNPGAVDYTRACHEAGALIFYLTGRHVGQPDVAEGMEQGTARSMTVRGFPFWTGRCELTLKRHAKEKDTEYKARALRVAESLGGEVVATFDNEPGNCNMFLKRFPKAVNVWMKTTWNPDDNDASPELAVIEDFRMSDGAP